MSLADAPSIRIFTPHPLSWRKGWQTFFLCLPTLLTEAVHLLALFFSASWRIENSSKGLADAPSIRILTHRAQGIRPLTRAGGDSSLAQPECM